MKISYNWIQEYLDFDLPPIEVLTKKIGAQLGGAAPAIDVASATTGRPGRDTPRAPRWGGQRLLPRMEPRRNRSAVFRAVTHQQGAVL